MPVNFDRPAYRDGIRQRVQEKFAGLNHTSGASDGDIYYMQNMTGDEYPVACPRAKRAILGSVEKPNGICYYDGLYYVDGTRFMRVRNGSEEADVQVGTVSDCVKRFACLGAYIIILPDKLYYNRLTGEFGGIEAEWSGTASFEDGTFAGEASEGCRIVTTGVEFPFRVGDAVTISGADNEANNQTIIVREISEDGKSLGFYEHSFINATGQSLTIKRTMPDLDFICENENRLWGCKGDTIYASKPGDPFNWNVFDGLASDSYAVDVGSSGDFTACVSYLGYPIFFKENRIYKVYGTKPSNFQVMSSATLGVLTGAERTLAVAGETLFYLSPVGVMAYTGGVPENISAAFGTTKFVGGSGGSDGVKYFASLSDDEGDISLYCYDTRIGSWHRQDNLDAIGFARGEGDEFQGAFALGADGQLLRVSGNSRIPVGWNTESDFESVLEFADFIEKSPNRKFTSKILIRAEVEDGATLTVLLSTDGGEYMTVNTLTGRGKKSYYLPFAIRRCDHFRVKLVGNGFWRLLSMTRECAEGSPL